MRTLPLSCVRTALPAVRPVWTPVITASAVPKALINFFSTKAGAGPIAQSKQFDKRWNKHGAMQWWHDLLRASLLFCFLPTVLGLFLFCFSLEVSLRQQRGRVKPVIAPVSPVMTSNPSVCPVLTATTWRVACVDSTVRWECILQMMVPADDVLPTVKFAQMTGPASVSY